MNSTFENLIRDNVETALDEKLERLAKQIADQVTHKILSALKKLNESEYLTRDEVLDLLKVAPSTLFNYVKAGLIKQYKLNEQSKRVYYKRTDLNEFILDN